MKTFLFVLFVFLHANVFAQFGEQKIILENPLSGTRSIQTADIDGDGDLDILVSYAFDNVVSWFENLDGQGEFGEQQIIGSLNFTNSSFPSDIDGDGDIDVISTSTNDDKLVLYKNNDSQGNFSSEIILANENSVRDAKTFDLDNDGDQDIVYISFAGARLQWLENTDGQGNFGPPQLISNNTPAGANVQGDDIDGDGDIDIVAAIGQLDTAAWYENLDGQGSFSSANIITTNANGIISVDIADMDGDGDLDVLSASITNINGETNVAWYENTDGQGVFIGENIITNDADFCYFVSAVDVDNDGDMDILSNSGETGNDRIFWQENLDGLGNFGPQISFGENIEFCRYIIGADIDDDGDSDVVYSDQNAGIVAWHENLTILGIQETNATLHFSVSPNPAKDTIIINSDNTIVQSAIFSALGILIKMQVNTAQIDVSSLSAGSYIIKAYDDTGQYGIEKFIKE